MPVGDQYRTARRALGVTQLELARLAEVSLATVQNIEAGRANASRSTLTRIGNQLGLRLMLEPIPADWQRLAVLGAPIQLAAPSLLPPSAAELRRELTRAAVQIETDPASVSARQRDALGALVLAIAHGYPSLFHSWFARAPLMARLVPDDVTGRLIKLKRIAASTLAGYL